MNTNWQDVLVILIVCLTMLTGIGVGAWMIIKGHPWFGLLIILIVCSIKVKTGY